MKKIFFAILFCLPLLSIKAQWDFSAAMGLDMKYAPSYRDYINYAFAPAGNELSSFSTAIDFSGEVGYLISPTFQAAIEYDIQFDSYNTSVGVAGLYEISYIAHRPSILGYYILGGEGYKFKFGGGVGYRYVSLDEKIISTTNYTASGIGFVAKAEGNTRLGENLFALIGVNLRYDLPGELSSGGQKIINPGNSENVNMNSLCVGIKLGITYSF
jgi:hypothetical protein